MNVIVKADVQGSAEAIVGSLDKIDHAFEVQLRIMHRGVGSITESDVPLAKASNAIVIGFNVRAGTSRRAIWPSGRVSRSASTPSSMTRLTT
ncbi:MAG: hypothetical protein MPW15_15815 [Candidatus Manganitrophus sp.]|nr:hypothetical protein [Candidatus Manganitrophus sp.]